jgi:kynurenine formamidase
VRTILCTLVVALLLGVGADAAEPGPALYPHDDMNRWGTWGSDDERGALPEGYSITRADLEAALAKQKTEVGEGDIVIVRTGVVPAWYTLSPVERVEFFAKPQTGLTSDVVPWVKEKKIAAIAADSVALERVPNEIDPELVVPLHGNLLRDLGVYIGEIWWLEELAADCAEDGRYEFFLAAQPLNITGAVGSPVNPIAIK